MAGERIKFENKEVQRKFFKKAKEKSNKTWAELAETCGILSGTFKFWHSGKYTPSQKVVYFLSKKLNIKIPRHKIISSYWYITLESSQKGAFARMKKYGLLGTKESRRKGGLISQKKRAENPEIYKKTGFKLRKKVKPFKKSLDSAELVGIILGDGSITSNQLRITLNKSDDREYSKYVFDLMNKVLGERPSEHFYGNTVELLISGVEYIEKLEKIGLYKGNKVKRQVQIPSWIIKNETYIDRCCRGLMDTDGGVYFHKHTTNNIKYTHFGLCFTNASIPLTDFVFKKLEKIGSLPKRPNSRRVYIYNLIGVKRYFEKIGTSNPKHINRLNKYLSLRGK